MKKNTNYSKPFKDNLTRKIAKWLELQDGEALINECKSNQKDDYFNLIQFYLRERFPSVALFEKKQNANITLMRSLSIAFALNILLYFIQLGLFYDFDQLTFNGLVTAWLLSCMICAIVAYHRFRLDQKYHAMYVFESFIATKKLLASKERQSRVDG